LFDAHPITFFVLKAICDVSEREMVNPEIGQTGIEKTAAVTEQNKIKMQ